MALYDDVFGSHPVFSEEYRTMQHVIDHIMSNLERPLPVEELAKVAASAERISRASSLPARAFRRPSSCCRNGCSAPSSF
jgi:hypothetical protein